MRSALLAAALLLPSCASSPKKCVSGEPGKLPEPLNPELIPAPEIIRAREMNRGNRELHITVYLCAAPTGDVTQIQVQKSTGPADLEQHIMDRVKQRWKFCHYELRPDEETLRCGTLTFNYDFH